MYEHCVHEGSHDGERSQGADSLQACSDLIFTSYIPVVSGRTVNGRHGEKCTRSAGGSVGLRVSESESESLCDYRRGLVGEVVVEVSR